MEGPPAPAARDSDSSPAQKSRPASPSLPPPPPLPLSPHEPGEHADSPMRKRPRLDTGAEEDEAGAMSFQHDDLTPASSSPDRTVAASDSPPHLASRALDNLPNPPLTPSKVTLNLRSSESSPVEDLERRQPAYDGTSADTSAGGSTAASTPSAEPMQVVVDAPSPSDPSPVVEILAESEDPDPYADMIEDDGIPLQTRLLDAFPYSMDYDPSEATVVIADDLSRNNFNPDLLDAVSSWIDQTWLKHVHNLGHNLYPMYSDYPDFWINLGHVYGKFLGRKIHYSNLGRITNTDVVARKLELFFEPYVRLCAQLVSVDLQTLRDADLRSDVLPDLLSLRHVKNLSLLFRNWNQVPLFKLLWDHFQVPAEQLQRKLALHLLATNSQGLMQIVDFARVLTSNGQLASKMCHDVEFAVTAIRYISLYLKELWLQHPKEELQGQYSDFGRNCLDLVRNLQQLLLESPLKANGLSHDLSYRLMDYAACILQDVADIDHVSAWSVVQGEFGDLKNVSAREAARLVMSCFHLRICWKYVAKGRMELRVSGVHNLSTHLVSLWREFSPVGAKSAYPPFQIIAQWIIDQKLVEYLVSVDSHPQLLVRSQDVPGFVMVTHHWTQDVTNAVWDTVDSSPDSRMIAEILEMLGKIVHLAVPSVVSAFCDKIEHLRTLTLTTAMHHFLEKLRPCLIDLLKSRNQQSQGDLRKPLLVFTRVVCDAATRKNILSAGNFAIVNGLHTMALSSLQSLSLAADDYDGRKEMYAQCFEEVRGRSQNSTGCLDVMLALLETHELNDLPFLLTGMDLLRRLSEDICSYIDEAKRESPNDPWLLALGPRLKLLARLVSSGPTSSLPTTSLPTEIQEKLWNHLVGQDAYNDQARDQAWSFLVSIVRGCNTGDPLIDRCIHELIMKLPPSLFTRGMFDFVQESMQYTQRVSPPPSPAEEKAIRVPLADLLWRIILQAPENTIEHVAGVLLSQYHLDTPMVQKAPLSSIAATHTALMERCIAQLKNAPGVSSMLSSSAIDGQSRTSPSAPSDPLAQEVCFRRTLQFMRRFIHEVRARPAFRGSEALPPSPASDGSTAHEMAGDPVVIQYQAFEPGTQKEVRELKVGSLTTVSELADRLRQRTGFTEFRAFHAGALFDFVKHGNNTVESIHGKGLLIIQNSGPKRGSAALGPDSQCTSVAEGALLNHFDTLYDLLGLDYKLSASLFEFLLAFPPHDRVRDLVLAPSPQLDELFPRGNRIKALYSLRCIREHLSRQLAGGLDSEPFTLKGVQVLTSVLTSSHIAPSASKTNLDVEVLAHLVDCLLIFLKQRPLQQAMTTCIVNEAAVAIELFILLEHGRLDPGPKPLFDCSKVYACLLEACFHSERIRQAFVSQANPEDLHYWLLVDNNDANQRQEIRLSIGSMCTNISGSTADSTSDVVPFFWKVLADLIPRAATKPFQSQELLASAKALFPDHYALCHDESSLRDHLASWTNVVASYRHCDETPQGPRDDFVLGISRLMSSCVSFLKSFKKPINGNRPMRILFQRYLFPPVSGEVADDAAAEQTDGAPILCADTRRELYSLVLALCENRGSYEWLVHQASVLLQRDGKGASSWNYDISRWLRSPTGYSGLRNLTNTCYMNSLLTQLFMNTKFRSFILSMPLPASRSSQKLLTETQRLLAYMQNSDNKFIDTWAFAEAIQPYDAEHIDICVQMDVDEFYNLLFDRWEGQMPSSETKEQFRSLYGGQLVTQIKSRDCEHVSETVEPFMTIQCEVRGKSTLAESLKAYVEGDAMEGDNKYKCESCGGRFVNAVKRSCMKNLPDSLIFHLKRFDFDLTTLDRHKINDEFAFPEQIDMREFGVDFINDPESAPNPDLFRLAGVLVHNGTAESGHYYSYIRLPVTSGNSAWAEFNDTEVSEFDPSNIPDQCFGGTTTHGELLFPKHYNAYMLFYERMSATESDANGVVSSQQRGLKHLRCPPGLEAEILSENETLSRQYCLFEPTHASFLKSLVSRLKDANGGSCSTGHEIERRVCEMTILHSSRVLSRIREVPDLESTITSLLRMVSSCGECANFSLSYLVDNADIAQNVLLVCPSSKARNIWGKLIIALLQNVKKMDSLSYGIEVDSNEFDASNLYDLDGNGITLDRTYESGLFHRVAVCLEDMLPSVGKFIRSWDDYFGLWAAIIDLGVYELAALLSHGLFLDLLELLHMAEFKRLASPKFQATHDSIIRHKRAIPRIGLINAVRSFFAHVNPCIHVEDHAPPVVRLEKYNARLQRFPVEVDEQRYIQELNPKGQLAFLNLILDGWDTFDGDRCAPADIVREILRCAFHDIPGCGAQVILRIGHSLAQALSEYHTLYTKATLTTCVVFFQTCNSIEEALPIFEEAVTSVETMKDQKREPQRNSHGACIDFGPQGGQNYLDFFQTLCDMNNAKCSSLKGESPYTLHVISQAPSWAPPLLLWDVRQVRSGAVSLLEQLIFNKYPYHLAESAATDESQVLEIDLIRIMANRALFESCCVNLQRAGSMHLPSSFIQATMAVMTQCASFCDKLCREESRVMRQLQTRLDRYLIQHGLSAIPDLADSSRKLVVKWSELEPKLRDWAYDSEGDEAISDTEWGSSFDDLSDAVTDV